jgi:DNA (cytosine-5)-methyltransferase 1
MIWGGVSHALTAKHSATGRYDPNGETWVAHALRGGGFDASEDGTGRGTPIVPISFDCKAGGNTNFAVGDVPGALRGEGHGGGHAAVAFAENSRAELRLCGGDGSVAAQLTTGGGKPGQGQPVIADQWAVRRLTPTECERLMGFPDGYTAVTYRGKPAADGPRYKALGNSMAVNVMRWIGRRIEAVDNATRDY